MKRDMELIKIILLSLEDANEIKEVNGYSYEQVTYHAALLQDAGLITQEGYFNMDVGGAMIFGTRMTWSGHEFLDASRDKKIWERAKRITLEKTGALTFEVLKAVLIQLGKDAISGAS